MNQITSNKQIDNHLNEDIINASISLSSFSFHGCFHLASHRKWPVDPRLFQPTPVVPGAPGLAS
jgi:hypothetical protein